MNVKRYQELAAIQKVTLLSFDEQEEMIALSTDYLYEMLARNDKVNAVLKRLKDR